MGFFLFEMIILIVGRFFLFLLILFGCQKLWAQCPSNCVTFQQNAHYECSALAISKKIQDFEILAGIWANQVATANSGRAKCKAQMELHRNAAGVNAERATHCTEYWHSCVQVCQAERACLSGMLRAGGGAKKIKETSRIISENHSAAKSCEELRDTKVKPLDNAATAHQEQQFFAFRCFNEHLFVPGSSYEEKLTRTASLVPKSFGSNPTEVRIVTPAPILKAAVNSRPLTKNPRAKAAVFTYDPNDLAVELEKTGN